MEIKPISCKFEYESDSISAIELIDSAGKVHRFTSITISDEFVIPQPFCCPFIVTDISERQWSNQNYEVEFASGYSREGVFTANAYEVSDAT